MKKIQIILSTFIAAALIIAGCKKIDNLPFYGNGTPVTLTASKATVAPTAADSSSTVLTLNWTNPKYASDSSTYKYIVEIDTATRNFAKATRFEITGKMERSFTGRELNAILLEYGFAIGTPVKLEMRVISSYGNNNERFTSNVVTVSVTAFTDPSVFTTSSNNVTGTLATASQNALTFSWTPSFKGYSGAVTYSVQFDSSGKNFAAPLEIAVGTQIFSKPMTQGEINTTALNKGVAGGSTGKIEYRLKATTAQGAVAYSNSVAVTIQTYVPLLRFYMPGSYQTSTGNGTDWNETNAPEFVRDLRSVALNRLYYMYIYLPANTEFKVIQGRSWSINYGGTGGNLSSTAGNISVATAGYYRISIDVVSMKYDIRAGRMGFVGDGSGAGWNPPNVFPTYAMGMPYRNTFVGLTTLSNNEWKLIDNNAWNNGSNAYDETRSYGTQGASESSLETNGANFAGVTPAGRWRVIWDGRDPNNVKYWKSLATQMRVVGDGLNQAGVNDWDPPTSPQMTYSGNGVWSITIALKANKDFKFVAGAAWGEFDYEDNSGQVQTTGTVRKINWDGGPNFKTPATAGTYTITLNEYTQTVTVN